MIRFVAAAALTVVAALPARAAVEVQEVTSPGGITAWLVEEPSIPFTALEIAWRGGTAIDREGKGGAVNLMMALLEEGTGDMDAQDFNRAREELAADFGFDAYRDSVSVSARFLTDNRDASIDLLRGAVVAPAFTEEAVERVRDQVLSRLRSDAQDPNTIASRTLWEGAYPGHPYASPSDGTVESVGALSRDDIVTAHRDTMVRDRMHIAAAGDITPDELGALLDRLLGDLPETSEVALPADIDWQREPGVEVVPFDTPQSVVMFGHGGVARDDPDFIPAYVLNQVFGGSGFNSRLMEEVRVKRGLTYGIGAYLATFDHAHAVLGQTASANAVVAQAVDVIAEEWAGIAEGVTEEELEAAKTYLTGAYPLRFDGNGRIANILVGMQLDGLGRDYIDERNEMVEAVTLDDVRRVAERLYRPDDLSFVVVGQPEGLPTN